MAKTTADLVLKNGLIVTPAGTLEGGVAMEWPEGEPGAKVIEASLGQYLRRELVP